MRRARPVPARVQREAPYLTSNEKRSFSFDALGGFFDACGDVFVDAFGGRDERRLEVLLDRLLRDHALGDVAPRRQLEHDVEQRVLDDRAEAARAGLALERLVGDLPERVVREDELDVVVAEEALVLLDERVLRLNQD